MSLESVRRVLRSLHRSAGFAITATLTLALGIGLSTAVFTIANAILLQRLPVADQDRIAFLWGETRDGRFKNLPFTLDDIRTVERASTSFTEIAFFPFRGAVPVPIRINDQSRPVAFSMVSGNFFSVLGAHPALGRALRTEDDVVGAQHVVVLSHRAWLQLFSGDSAVIGKTIVTIQNGVVHTVVGVMPQGLEYPRGTDLWAPIVAYSTVGGFHDLITKELDAVARLRPRVSHAQVRGELSRFFARADAPPLQRYARGVVQSFSNEVLGDTRPTVLLIGLTAALLLFISCVNVANLLLVRAMGRTREFIVRAALGASRERLLVQSLAETGVLVLAGAAIGGAFAVAAVRTFILLAPVHVARLNDFAPDRGMLLVATVVTLAAMLVSGAGPALFVSRVDAGQSLRSGGRSTGSPALRRVLKGLVSAQIALAVVSLVAAGLMSRSLYWLTNPTLSFDPDGLVVSSLAVASPQLPDAQQTRAALALVQERLHAMPNVRAVSLAFSPPFVASGGGIDGRLSTPGQGTEERARNPVLNMEIAEPQYFQTLGIPILRGRAFTDDDREGSSPVVVISASVARQFWPGEDAIGKRLVGVGKTFIVVGVAPDTRYRDLRSARSTIYFPLRQSSFGDMVPTTLLIRVTGSRSAFISQLRTMIAQTSSGLTIVSVTPVDALLDGPRGSARLNTIVLGLIASAALVLSGVGLFVIMATTVRQRTHELGVRMALGATARDVGTLVMRQALVLALIGGSVGVAVSLATGRLLSTLLFATGTTDVTTIAGVGALTLLVTVIAGFLPARASARIEPAVALRSE